MTDSNGPLLSLRLPGGDLFGYLVKNGPLSELEAKFATYQVLQALQVRHEELCPPMGGRGYTLALTYKLVLPSQT